MTYQCTHQIPYKCDRLREPPYYPIHRCLYNTGGPPSLTGAKSLCCLVASLGLSQSIYIVIQSMLPFSISTHSNTTAVFIRGKKSRCLIASLGLIAKHIHCHPIYVPFFNINSTQCIYIVIQSMLPFWQVGGKQEIGSLTVPMPAGQVRYVVFPQSIYIVIQSMTSFSSVTSSGSEFQKILKSENSISVTFENGKIDP